MVNGSLLEIVIQLRRHGAKCSKMKSLEVGYEGRRWVWEKGNACRECMGSKLKLQCRRCAQSIGELLELYAGHGG